METLLEVIGIFVVAGLYISVWTWIVGRRADNRIEQSLWLTLRRVANRHGLEIPDGLSVDEAGTYIEEQLHRRIVRNGRTN